MTWPVSEELSSKGSLGGPQRSQSWLCIPLGSVQKESWFPFLCLCYLAAWMMDALKSLQRPCRYMVRICT